MSFLTCAPASGSLVLTNGRGTLSLSASPRAPAAVHFSVKASAEGVSISPASGTIRGGPVIVTVSSPALGAFRLTVSDAATGGSVVANLLCTSSSSGSSVPSPTRSLPPAATTPAPPPFTFTSTGPLVGKGAFGLVRLGVVVGPLPHAHGPVPPPGTLVAIKEVPISSYATWLGACREAAALAACRSSSHVVVLQGLLRCEPSAASPLPRALLIMDYVPGGTLAQLASAWSAPAGSVSGAMHSPYAGGGGGAHSAAPAPAAGTPARRRRRGIPEGLVRVYARGILEGVAHVHAQGLAHRDIKGANLLLGVDGGVRLADFGSCKLGDGLLEGVMSEQEHLSDQLGEGGGGEALRVATGGGTRPKTAITAAGIKQGAGKAGGSGTTPSRNALLSHNSSRRGEHGTIAWMAPEVVTTGWKGGALSPHAQSTAVAAAAAAAAVAAEGTSMEFWQRADMWSVGCTVLELLTGEQPWSGMAEDAEGVMLCIASSDLRARTPSWVSPAAVDFLRLCLQPNAADRPTARDLLASHAFVSSNHDAALFEHTVEEGVDSSDHSGESGVAAATSVTAATPQASGWSRLSPVPSSLVQGPPIAAISRALHTCDSLRSEVRLACRHAQRWYAVKAGVDASNAPGWVASCTCTEERVGLTELSEHALPVAAAYGPACTAALTAACHAPLHACAHRACSGSVLFGSAAGVDWTVLPETALLLSALCSPHPPTLPPCPARGGDGLVACVLHLLFSRVSRWEPAGAPLVASAVAKHAAEGLPAPPPPPSPPEPTPSSLSGLALSLQWLAAARATIASRIAAADDAAFAAAEDDEDEDGEFYGGAAFSPASATLLLEEGGGGLGPPVGDFAVLYFARLHVWVIELEGTLAALIAVAAWWPIAAASDSGAFDLPALAKLHASLLRKAYARLLRVQAAWAAGKGSAGFRVSEPQA